MPPKDQPRRQLRRGRPPNPTEDNEKATSPTNAPELEANQHDVSIEVEQAHEASQRDKPDVAESSSGQPTHTEQFTSTPTPPASLLPRKPVERLASLHSPYISSTNERTLGSTAAVSRPSSLRFQPKSYTRRTKEEREAAERAEAERSQASAGAPEIGRGGFISRGRGRGHDFVHSTRDERLTGSGATGHLGARVAGPVVSKYRRGGRAGQSSGSRSQATEDTTSTTGGAIESSGRITAVKTEKEKDGDVVMGATKPRAQRSQVDGAAKRPGGRKTGGTQGGGKSAKIKQESLIPEYPWSDDDEVEEEGRRIDIEEINLISDQEGDDDGLADEDTKGKEREITPRQPQKSFKPIRLDRKEHQERARDVNTNASSITSAELRRRNQEERAAQGSLFLDDDELVVPTVKTKSRGKARDVEFVRDERKWKGVYQDDDDSDTSPKVKEEPPDNDAMAVDDVPATAGASPPKTSEVVLPEPVEVEDIEMAEAASPSVQPQDDPAPESIEPKRHPPRRKLHRPPKSLLQTHEDHQEWERGQRDKYKIVETLCQVVEETDPAALAADDEEHVEVDETSLDRHFRDLFLFQFPPALPMLVDPTKEEIKPEPSTDLAQPTSPTQPEPVPIEVPQATISKTPAKKPPAKKAKTPASSAKAKPTSKNSASTATAATEPTEPAPPPTPQTYTPLSPAPPPGHFGALRLHASSRTSCDWGSLLFEISRGSEENMAQEFVVCDWSAAVVKKEPWETTGVGGGGSGGGGRGDSGVVNGGKAGRVRGDEATVKEEERDEWKEELKVGGQVWAMGEVGGGHERAALVGVPCWGEMFGV